MANLTIHTDSVVDTGSDLLDFQRYLGPLENILTNPSSVTPFTVGLFGPWGSGKSTLLEMLANRLDSKNFLCVKFNPWVFRKEPNMLVPLLHTLHDTLTDSSHGGRFVESAKKIWGVLVRLGADTLLKGLTADALTLEKLEKAEEIYLKERGRFFSEIRRLREFLQKEMDAITKSGARVVIFIDDLDRCEPEQIIDVLESAKLFFDLKNVSIVLAIDKEVIDRGIQVKYNKFRFAADREPVIGSEYLEKMVQLPMQLYPLQPSQVGSFINKFGSSNVKLVSDHTTFLETVLFPNPRKIKRVLNILTVTDAIRLATPDLVALDTGVLVRLVVLQVQAPELYSEVVRQPDLLAALEDVFAAKRRASVQEDFNDFAPRSAAIQKLCQRFYDPTTHLSHLFKEAGFVKAKTSLTTYLSMVGA